MNHVKRTIGRLAAVAAVAAVIAGSAPDAEAADAVKRPDFGSRAAFKQDCEVMGGTFSLDGIGNTECHFPGGGWIECDLNGNDCWYTPPPRRLPSGWGLPGSVVSRPGAWHGSASLNLGGDATDGGTQADPSAAPVDAGGQTADRDDKPEKTKAKHKGKAKGKQRGHGKAGKR